MKNKLFIFLLLIYQSTDLYSQLITDRPNQTDTSVIINTGDIQIETGISLQEIETNISSLIRIGIMSGFELRINANYLINDQISFQRKSSFSDFVLGSKFKIFNSDKSKAKISFLSNISIPTAPEIFSFNEYGFLNKILISHDFKSNSQIISNLGYSKFTNYQGQYIYSLVYGKRLESFSIFFELFGDSNSNFTNLNFDSGLTYLLDSDNQFDLSIGKGLDNDLFFVKLGFSFRIN